MNAQALYLKFLKLGDYIIKYYIAGEDIKRNDRKFIVRAKEESASVETGQEMPEHVKTLAPEIGLVYKGMPREDLYKVFSPYQQKDYRRDGNQEWFEFSD